MNYNKISKDGYKPFIDQLHFSEKNIDPKILCLIYLRISQINDCQYCIDTHYKESCKYHDPEKINLIYLFRESNLFSQKEITILAFAEDITMLQNNKNINDLKEFYTDKEIVDIVYAISNMNALNRIAITFK